MEEQTIDKIVKQNVQKLRKPKLHNGIDFNTKLADSEIDYHTVKIEYNTQTGEITTRPAQHDKGKFSEITLAWNNDGTYGFRPYNNPSNATHRLSDDDRNKYLVTDCFGTEPGDKVLEQSIQVYNALRTYGEKHSKTINKQTKR